MDNISGNQDKQKSRRKQKLFSQCKLLTLMTNYVLTIDVKLEQNKFERCVKVALSVMEFPQ